MQADLGDTVVTFTRHGLGDAEPALALKLAVNYLRTLEELELRPRAIVFYAAGVKLVAAGSPCIEPLQRLQAAGTSILACRTCLDFYGLADQVAAGEIGNMAQIVELQASAARVISV
jgi:intracellular sulfur oxidation DsrE/DsrF family protein